MAGAKIHQTEAPEMSRKNCPPFENLDWKFVITLE